MNSKTGPQSSPNRHDPQPARLPVQAPPPVDRPTPSAPCLSAGDGHAAGGCATGESTGPAGGRVPEQTYGSQSPAIDSAEDGAGNEYATARWPRGEAARFPATIPCIARAGAA